ncbi:PREDICTED: gastrula zinc finger protein XlCGF49.1-like [Charadrius vociferus]|uniref:gastrula zinc finger protein XlCGF49.1-like n=1 Tax=Charadrius vociferus TaxID=50402 RepID=UPI000521CC88|nr:PREDICTED: gastrula zinc finger protein XlCGF49.1-like [Charadrius vociferus]
MTLKFLEVENFLSHIQEMSHTCLICGYSFKHKAILAAHQKSQKKETEAESCEKEGDVDWAGDLHNEEAIRSGEGANREGKHSSHSDPERREKPRACTEYRKNFKVKVDLSKHLQIHTGERLFPCTDCSKRFITKSQLKEHQRIHTGKWPYKCLDRGKNFTQKLQLIVHHQIHRGEKSYKCNSCQKSFVDKSQLVAHHRIHTGDRPFKYEVCDHLFRQKIKHQQVHSTREHSRMLPGPSWLNPLQWWRRSFTVAPAGRSSRRSQCW